jgi:hypothetical protein
MAHEKYYIILADGKQLNGLKTELIFRGDLDGAIHVANDLVKYVREGKTRVLIYDEERHTRYVAVIIP